MPESANISRHLSRMAASHPDLTAIKVPRGHRYDGSIEYLVLSFAELDAEVNAWCARLHRKGVRPGERVLVMVKQGLPLIASVFALFKLGAVPVVIDPGMGLRSFLRCVKHTRPRHLLGIPVALVLSVACLPAFTSLRSRIRVSANACDRLAPRHPAEAVPPLPRQGDDLAAILFTSGSTGAPKGVCYEHGMFEAQVEMIRSHYRIQPGEIDLPMLPIFALFNPALGMTTIVPAINPSKPASVDPAEIVRAILQENVTNSFGSPTLWTKISAYCERHRIELPTMRRVLCAGAPVPSILWKRAPAMLPNGALHSPYGATEALPVSSLCHQEVDTESTAGACVGRPLPGVEIRIIAAATGTVSAFSEAKLVPTGEIGEIVVSGPMATKAYHDLPDATAAAKIPDGARTWHRMGDLGYLDAAGRLWFCGRKVETVQTAAGPLYTEPVEQVFRAHPEVARCALVGVGKKGEQRPAVVVQPAAELTGSDQVRLAEELRRLGKGHRHTAELTDFHFHPSLPVDVRHNAKIHRLTLAAWAAVRTPVSVP